MKAVVAAFIQEKALVGAFSVIANLRMELFKALVSSEQKQGAEFDPASTVLATSVSAPLVKVSASKRTILRFAITEKAPTRAFSWLKAATTAFTFKTLLRHYAKQALTPK